MKTVPAITSPLCVITSYSIHYTKLYECKPDLDNVVKLILDAINGIVFADDKQVVSISASKAYSDTPRTTVQTTEIVITSYSIHYTKLYEPEVL